MCPAVQAADAEGNLDPRAVTQFCHIQGRAAEEVVSTLFDARRGGCHALPLNYLLRIGGIQASGLKCILCVHGAWGR